MGQTKDTGPQALRRLRGIIPGGYSGIARRLKVSRQTVSAWASGRTAPTVASVRLMARHLGVSQALWTN